MLAAGKQMKTATYRCPAIIYIVPRVASLVRDRITRHKSTPRTSGTYQPRLTALGVADSRSIRIELARLQNRPEE